ncbi:GPI ethanolamine phosphate transferase 2 isoform X3 [Sarcophilus harrisii]|uniref:Phosphatidylinositol glycan anchor biosynthesis class G (EMM blood group) n=1 Tax=Sarcophilus harrisii TaxID=9305 RepID=A0A7N4P6P1_SARHA|nr:GPI ethanolamine phosphate transferase 2 isoform X3 [Sarcophilus harrisii]
MRLGSGAFAASCVVIELLGVAVFLRGFFPVSVRSASRARLLPPAPEPAAGTSSNWTQLPPPLFRKVVIMLVDGLRGDFVFGSKGVEFMPYTTYLIEKGFTHSFIAEAKPPTVTLPRIKALMTGSIPGFIDAVRNFNSPVLLEDNLIGQAKTAGKRIIFYGDDTWIKLFPKHFVEYDGTTSFFVSDFREVDDNITRHLDNVLKREDWDMLILHYLGLDHIGHVTGPHSPLVGPKLKEMDYILKKIHISLLSKEREASLPHLLVLCGDHGMSETGGHGASSVEEVSTPLVLISSAFQRKSGNFQPPKHVQQTDLAATLAVGLGLPIPKNSVGSLLFPVVEGATMREQLRFLHLNSVQLSRLLQENVPMFEKDPGYQQFKESEKLHGNWIKLYLEGNNSEVLLNLGRKVLKQYLNALKTLSMSLSKQVAQYDMYSMMVGTVIVLENQAASSSSWSGLDLLILFGTLGHVLSLGASSFIEEEHQTWYFLINTLCLALGHEMCRNHFLGKDFDHNLTMEGDFQKDTEKILQYKNDHVDVPEYNKTHKLPSSLELPEGYEKWLGLASPWLILICCRLLRSLNQTGVQWAHRPDFGHWLTSSDHKAALSVLAFLSLVMIFILVQRRCSPVSKVAMALGLLGIYCYRAAFGNVFLPWQRDNKDISKGIIEARFVYVFVLGILFTGTKDLLKSQVISTDVSIKSRGLWEIYSGLVLLAALLLRPHNLPILVFSLLIQAVMAKCIWKPLKHDAAQITIMHYWFGQAFFYFQGNSNNLATLDVSAGFVGLDHYVELPAMFLTAFATYIGPILWAVHLLSFLSSENTRRQRSKPKEFRPTQPALNLFAGRLNNQSRNSAMGHACFCYAVICSIPVSAYIILVTSLRYHLFIWSVFSPKLLYEGMHLLLTATICVFFTAMDQTNLIKP